MDDEDHSINNKNVVDPIRPNNRKRFDQLFWQFLKQNVYLLSYLISILIVLACIIPYILSVGGKHVPPILPYISDAGSFTPVAGFFSGFMDSIVAIGAIVMIIRFKQIRFYIRHHFNGDDVESNSNSRTFEYLNLLNFFSITSISIAAIGIIMIGNFRVSEHHFMHITGVFLYMLFSSIHYLIMIIILRKLYKNGRLESYPTSIIIIFTVLLLSIIMIFIPALILNPQCAVDIFMNHDRRNQLTPDECGYYGHVISATFEYVYFMTYVPYFWSIGNRLRKFKRWNQVKF